MPCHPARARELLAKGKAIAIRHLPFLLRLKHHSAGQTQPLTLKIDPGANCTGLALTTPKRILGLIELTHRKSAIIKKMAQRRAYRRRRRTANIRCRQPRFLNRRRTPGWLPPSIRSVANNVLSWASRLRRWTPITTSVIENCKFDTQKIQNPEISGTEYQRGTLYGFELWEYLLAKFGHKCAYCNVKNVPLTRDHVIPKSTGGSDRVSNLTLACLPCNQAKGNSSVEGFLTGHPAKLARLKSALRRPLTGAATMNILRKSLFQKLEELGIPVDTTTGGHTKFNRQRFNIPKTHALDAAFTGTITTCPQNWQAPVLALTATGRGSHCRTKTDKFGFPRLHLPRIKMIRGFQTGDIVSTPKGKGRIAVRSNGHFSLRGNKKTIKSNQCRLLQRADGYNYRLLPVANCTVSV